MRFPTQVLPDASSASAGAILSGDGELVVPPVSQPVIDLAYPIEQRAAPAAGDRQTRSFAFSTFTHVAGADAGFGATTLRTLGKGLWCFHFSGSGRFDGTNNVAGQYRTFLQGIGGGTQCGFSTLRFHPAHSANHNFSRLFVVIRDDDWLLQHQRDATIAGDTLSYGWTLYALKCW